MQQGPPTLYYRSCDFSRLEILHQCLHSAISTTETYLSFTPDQYSGVNIIFMLIFRHSTQLLYQLSLLEDPGWDRAWVRETIDVVNCIDQAAERLEVASDIAGSVDNGSAQHFYFQTAVGLRISIPAWRAALAPVWHLNTEGLNGCITTDFTNEMWFTNLCTS